MNKANNSKMKLDFLYEQMHCEDNKFYSKMKTLIKIIHKVQFRFSH